MGKFAYALGAGVLSTAFAIVLTKAQIDPNLWYAWILKDPHVVPGLLAFSALCFLVALGRWDPVARTYWRVLAWLIPSPERWDVAGTGTPLPFNGLHITSAIWRCVDDPTIFNVVTGTANSLIREAKILTAKPENRVFGDPCNKHRPYVRGHHKNLELTYVFQGNKLLSEYDPPHTLTISENWDTSKDFIAPQQLVGSNVVPNITFLGANIIKSQRDDMPLGNQVRIMFRNDCGHAISVSRPNWNPGPRGVAGTVLGHQIHIKRMSQWNPEHRSLDVLQVDPAAVFEVWVGIKRDYSIADLTNRHDRKILGVLSLAVDDGKEAVFEL